MQQSQRATGKVRHMNAAGLERKFKLKEYVDWVHSLDSAES